MRLRAADGRSAAACRGGQARHSMTRQRLRMDGTTVLASHAWHSTVICCMFHRVCCMLHLLHLVRCMLLVSGAPIGSSRTPGGHEDKRVHPGHRRIDRLQLQCANSVSFHEPAFLCASSTGGCVQALNSERALPWHASVEHAGGCEQASGALLQWSE